VAYYLERLGQPAAAQRIREFLPKPDTTRKGNFGEVVASEHLVQRYSYVVPVLKLRFRERSDVPTRGEDIVAFLLSPEGDIKRLCIGEAKTRVTYGSRAVREGHDRLVGAYHPRPETLSLIIELLYNKGDNALARKVEGVLESLASTGFPRDNWLFVITESGTADPFGAIQQLNDVVPQLSCVDLQLEGLSQFVAELFDRPCIVADGGVTDGS
jgi:hypothetical protein